MRLTGEWYLRQCVLIPHAVHLAGQRMPGFRGAGAQGVVPFAAEHLEETRVVVGGVESVVSVGVSVGVGVGDTGVVDGVVEI